MENVIQSGPMLSHYGINIIVAFIFIVLIYNRFRTHQLGYVFTYFMFNTIVFFVSCLLSAITLSVGFAFGLFAVFGIMRYRTEPIPIREMTYLFGAITIGLINGLAIGNFGLIIVLIPNTAILIMAYLLEFFLTKDAVLETLVIYEKIENINPARHDILLSDLRERTGLKIKNFIITRVDFLRDVARIRVFYREK